MRLLSVRQSIEHIFALHKNTFKLFNVAERFRLMLGGLYCYMLLFNSFFFLNCYVCLNKSPNNSNIRPPSLEEYIPLGEVLIPAHVIDDDLLEEI